MMKKKKERKAIYLLYFYFIAIFFSLNQEYISLSLLLLIYYYYYYSFSKNIFFLFEIQKKKEKEENKFCDNSIKNKQHSFNISISSTHEMSQSSLSHSLSHIQGLFECKWNDEIFFFVWLIFDGIRLLLF